MSPLRSVVCACGLLASLALNSGCGNTDSVSVAGVATLDGQPLGDASLEFVPIGVSNSGAALARTDDRGQFRIAPGAQNRLGPGKYAVRVTKWVDKKTKLPVSAEDQEQLKLGKLATNILPVRYDSTGSDAVVTADLKMGQNDLKIDVTSK